MAETKEAPKVKPIGVKLPGDFTVTAHGHVLTSEQLADMSPDAIGYLLKVGFTGSVTDAAAMSKEIKAKFGTGLDAEIKARRAKRFADILAGDVSHGGSTGARPTAIERFVSDVALEKIKAMAAKNGVPMPKKDALKAAVSKVLEHPELGSEIRAEAQKRLDAASASADVVADLFKAA